MKYTIEMGTIDTIENFATDETFLVDHLVNAPYRKMIEIFGQPSMNFADNQTKAEWVGKINGEAFLIYDYHNPYPLEMICRWHIAALTEKTAKLIQEYWQENSYC